jgi:hypothetical protein
MVIIAVINIAIDVFIVYLNAIQIKAMLIFVEKIATNMEKRLVRVGIAFAVVNAAIMLVNNCFECTLLILICANVLNSNSILLYNLKIIKNLIVAVGCAIQSIIAFAISKLMCESFVSINPPKLINDGNVCLFIFIIVVLLFLKF